MSPAILALSLLALFLWVMAGFLLVHYFHVLYPVFGFGGAPYVPTHPKRVGRMIALAEIRPTDRVADLGSGDGRIVIAAAGAGARQVVGYEVDGALVAQSRTGIEEKGLASVARIEKSSFWQADLRSCDVVFCFQIPYAMDRIRRKLEQELKPGARIVSNGFKIPGWPILREEDHVFLYRR